MKRRSFLFAAMPGVVLAACSPAPAPVSSSPRDPSNPHASEGAAPPAAPAHEAVSEATRYVCPMHPEVVSSAPGVCPKCNMKLVPAKG